MTDIQDITPEGARFLELGATADGRARCAAARPVDVEVEHGTIRVYHVAGRDDGRPVVFIAGWGAIWESFSEFYVSLAPGTEVFHVETREKSSSRIDRRSALFTMDHYARDVRSVVEHFGLAARDPVLMGTCFGSAILMHGLAAGILEARSVVCVDPMQRLWVPRWIVSFLGPVLPTFVLRFLRAVIGAAVLAGMRQPVQRARTRAFIRDATVWKWRRAAIAVNDWNLFDIISRISSRIHVVNGSHDRFHDSDQFPNIARALPDGIFIHIPVGESNRERLMGITASEFSSGSSAGATPEALRPFIREIADRVG